ncbi:unnamed protein product [Bathycoccus prasinos]
MGRRKNPHPKRAENARTVLKGEEFREKEEVKEPVVVCLQIPDDDDDDDEMDEQIRKEEPTFRKGSKRKRTQHECDVCEKVFRYPSKLVSHTRTRDRTNVIHMRIHTNEKPYECDFCERHFSQLGTLQNHVRIHTNEKPYECEVCERCFRESSTLKVHMRIHTNEKPYECEACEMKFRQSSNFRRHMRTQH